MNLDDKKRRLIVIGIALLLILMGVVEGVFKIKIDRKVSDEVSFVLMMIAAWLLLSGKKFGKNAKKDQNSDPNPSNDVSQEIAAADKADQNLPESSVKSDEPEQRG